MTHIDPNTVYEEPIAGPKSKLETRLLLDMYRDELIKEYKGTPNYIALNEIERIIIDKIEK